MIQEGLFSSSTLSTASSVTHLVGGGIIDIYPSWLEQEEAGQIFNCFMKELHWEQPDILLYGKAMKIPRMQAWYGDQGKDMIYSGKVFKALSWHPGLVKLQHKLRDTLAVESNSVLANLYRDGRDSVSWHADDEKELGSCPVIASISLGAERKFSLKPKPDCAAAGEKPIHFKLRHGDLIVMRGQTQRNWLHAVQKDNNVGEARINLTFRKIVA